MFSTSKSYGDTDFITGMRALAALAVLFIHTGGAGLRDLGEVANNFVDLGKSGVYVFFVISGFSVAQSLKTSSGYFDYLNKRIWRVAPLYYFWLLAAIALSVTASYWQDRFGAEVDAYNVLMHFGFLSFLDYRIANTILGVEWSIPIEVFWYLFMPVFLILSKRKLALIAMVLVSAFIHKAVEKHAGSLPLPAVDAALAIHWSPLPYLFNFCLGVAAFRIRDMLPKHGVAGNAVIIFSFLLVVAYCLFPSAVRSVFRDDYFMMSWVTFFMIVTGSPKSALFNNIFASRPMVFLGTISYGVYLCHMPIINLFAKVFPALSDYHVGYFISVTVTACVISLITFHAIEKPGGVLGKKIGALPIFTKVRSSPTPI